MTIQFLGAAGEVTGSCFFLEEGGLRFLVDCGMFQGSATADQKNQAPWPFDPASINFVLLTHAHFDHCGRLPKLYHDGFRGHIFATPPTLELSDLILEDAADLMFHEARFQKSHPLYTLNEVKALNGLYRPARYQELHKLGPDLTVKFNDAGHILGSAIVEIETKGQKIVFSGDLGNHPVPLMNPPTILKVADVLVVESTYGNRMHQHANRVHMLQKAIMETASRGGTVLIPAFALERTQEILYHLNDLKEQKAIPDLPIFVDSPLAIQATAVFRRNEQLFDQEAQSHLKHGDDFFAFPHLKYCSTVEESKAINFVPAPKIIIAGSGMLNGGRILHHLLHYGGDAKTLILMVGYQVEGSLGRRILDGERKVRVMRDEMEIAAEVKSIPEFSAHADQAQLLEWLEAFQKLAKVYIVHGEEENRRILAEKLHSARPETKIMEPKLSEVAEV